MSIERPKIGDREFGVSYCPSWPEDGEPIMRHKYFRTRAAARSFAKKIFPKDMFGSVEITEYVYGPDDFDDGYLDWQTGDSEYYDGESFHK